MVTGSADAPPSPSTVPFMRCPPSAAPGSAIGSRVPRQKPSIRRTPATGALRHGEGAAVLDDLAQRPGLQGRTALLNWMIEVGDHLSALGVDCVDEVPRPTRRRRPGDEVVAHGHRLSGARIRGTHLGPQTCGPPCPQRLRCGSGYPEARPPGSARHRSPGARRLRSSAGADRPGSSRQAAARVRRMQTKSGETRGVAIRRAS